MTHHNILVAFDGSKPSEMAMKRAVCMVKEHPGTKLTVLYVFHIPNIIVGESFFGTPSNVQKEYNENAALLIQEAEKAIEGLDQAEVEVRQGLPAEEIIACAEEKGCDLIVIGSRGLGGLREVVLGSVSHSVVQKAKIPVYIVKS